MPKSVLFFMYDLVSMNKVSVEWGLSSPCLTDNPFPLMSTTNEVIACVRVAKHRYRAVNINWVFFYFSFSFFVKYLPLFINKY